MTGKDGVKVGLGSSSDQFIYGSAVLAGPVEDAACESSVEGMLGDIVLHEPAAPDVDIFLSNLNAENCKELWVVGRWGPYRHYLVLLEEHFLKLLARRRRLELIEVQGLATLPELIRSRQQRIQRTRHRSRLANAAARVVCVLAIDLSLLSDVSDGPKFTWNLTPVEIVFGL